MRAEFGGHCDLCDERIRPGDDIRPQGGLWVHVDCISRLEGDVDKVLVSLGMSPRPRCRSCADLLAADGSCSNCD